MNVSNVNSPIYPATNKTPWKETPEYKDSAPVKPMRLVPAVRRMVVAFAARYFLLVIFH